MNVFFFNFVCGINRSNILFSQTKVIGEHLQQVLCLCVWNDFILAYLFDPVCRDSLNNDEREGGRREGEGEREREKKKRKRKGERKTEGEGERKRERDRKRERGRVREKEREREWGKINR